MRMISTMSSCPELDDDDICDAMLSPDK